MGACMFRQGRSDLREEMGKKGEGRDEDKF